MKKLFSMLFILALLVTTAYADQYDEFVQQQYDFKEMNDEQLQGMIKMGEALIRNAQAEIDSRNSSESSEAAFDTSVHTMEDIEYSIVKFEKDTDDGKDVIKMYVDWKNTGDEPNSIITSSFMVSAYQSGKEAEAIYLSDNGVMDNYMPGYGGTVFFAFENKDNTEMTFFINDLFSIGDENNWSFVINPNDL